MVDDTLAASPSDRVPARDDLPQAIGRFSVRGVLGEGGMGVVFDAVDPNLGRRVAVKLVRGEANESAFRARLLREAAAMARVDHPNVVRVYEVGSDRDRLFVAMELVEGTNLRAWLQADRTTTEILAMFEQVGAGLAAVHANGLVHRDFKPDNVLVDHDGHARVADFGLARLDVDGSEVSPALAATLTRTGALMGTPGYMAPEQQLGATVDARADQYSFCVALREALSGGRPTAGGDPGKWARAPRSVRDLIARGLAYDPHERFASMAELLAILHRAERGRRGSVLVLAAIPAALGVTVVVALAARSSGSSTATAPRDSAERMVAAAPVERAVPSDASVPFDAEIHEASISRAEVHPAAQHAGPHDGGAKRLQPPPPFTTPSSRAATDASSASQTVHEIDPAHVAAVRSAVRELGYTGLTITGDDFAGDLAHLQHQLAAIAEDDHVKRGRVMFAIGALQRRHDACGDAIDSFRNAVAELAKAPQQHDDPRWAWMARSHFGIGLCELAAGHALAAREPLGDANRMIGFTQTTTYDIEHAQPLLAEGIAMWESGDEVHGKEIVIMAGRRSEPLRPMLEAWANAVGMRLP